MDYTPQAVERGRKLFPIVNVTEDGETFVATASEFDLDVPVEYARIAYPYLWERVNG